MNIFEQWKSTLDLCVMMMMRSTKKDLNQNSALHTRTFIMSLYIGNSQAVRFEDRDIMNMF